MQWLKPAKETADVLSLGKETAAGMVACSLSPEKKLSLLRPENSSQQTKQLGLSGPGWSIKKDYIAGAQLQLGSIKNRPVKNTEADIDKLQHQVYK